MSFTENNSNFRLDKPKLKMLSCSVSDVSATYLRETKNCFHPEWET